MSESTEWFRRVTWTDTDRAEFSAKLKRARRKTEYLLVQAHTLLDTGNPSYVAAALELLDLLVSAHHNEFYLSNAHLARAEALVKLGQDAAGAAAFRAALDARRNLPNVINSAYLEYAWTAARLGWRNLYPEVLAALQEFASPADLVFPSNAYRYFGALALISADEGDIATAQRWATEAIRAASSARGPFSRHPDFGVLDTRAVDPDAHGRLWGLASK